MSGRAATSTVIPGRWAISVGRPALPAPPGWEWVPLSEAARLETGHTPSRERPEYWNGDIPWIGIPDAHENHGRVISSTRQTVTQAGLDNSAARLLPAGTVCLSRTASVGYVVVMGRPMATSQDFVNWVCGPRIEPQFLKYLLFAETESLRRFAKGSTHSTIYFPEVKAFYVCLPNAAEQRRLVSKLDELRRRSRAARDALHAVVDLSQQVRQSVMRRALGGQLTTGWRGAHRTTRPAAEALASVRASHAATERRKVRLWGSGRGTSAAHYGQLPKSWTWAQVGQLGEAGQVVQIGPMSMRSSEFSDDGRIVLNVGCVRDGWIDVSRADHLPHSRAASFERYSLRAEDIAFTRSGSVGRCALVPPTLSGALMTFHLLRVRVDRTLCDPRYLLLAFRASAAIARQIAEAAIGATRAGFNTRLLEELWIPLPPIDEQGPIVNEVEKFSRSVSRTDLAVSEAGVVIDQLDASILAQAFQGRLTPQDPNDERTSVVFDRFRGAEDEPLQPRMTRGVRS